MVHAKVIRGHTLRFPLPRDKLNPHSPIKTPDAYTFIEAGALPSPPPSTLMALILTTCPPARDWQIFEASSNGISPKIYARGGAHKKVHYKKVHYRENGPNDQEMQHERRYAGLQVPSQHSRLLHWSYASITTTYFQILGSDHHRKIQAMATPEAKTDSARTIAQLSHGPMERDHTQSQETLAPLSHERVIRQTCSPLLSSPQ